MEVIEYFQTVNRISYSNKKPIFRISHFGLSFLHHFEKNSKDELDMSEFGTNGKVTESLSETSSFVTDGDFVTIVNFQVVAILELDLILIERTSLDDVRSLKETA